ncbi:MAG: ImmA/IrrE family metallo-endopeptidase [Chloroflexi bacterium]|nr:ImmA/IrrE family metallo-endopeptidase [Chloroflexota bacterium]
MAISPTADIGANLQRMRGMRGLTQEAAAEAAGLSRAAYRNLEAGLSEPRASPLVALAKALQVSPADLLLPAPPPPQARFRSKLRLKDRPRILHDVGRELEDYASLERLVDEARPYLFAGFIAPDDANRARAVAELVRERLELGDDPIFDISGLLEDKVGSKVLWLEIASDGFFGMSVAEDGSGPAIVVNSWDRISVERQIFTAAHELGHLLLHRDEFNPDEVAEDVDAEREADRFAAYLLMPEPRFTKEWQEVRGLSLFDAVMKIKRIFRVSYRTVLHRLDEQGLKDVWPRFMAQAKGRLGRALTRTDEPDPLSPAARGTAAPEPLRGREPFELVPSDFDPDRRMRLIRRALDERRMSLSRAAEILGLDLRKMRELHQSWA